MFEDSIVQSLMFFEDIAPFPTISYRFVDKSRVETASGDSFFFAF
jgi:hypothetical protein